QAVDIRFTYDLNGVLEVEATIVETKQKFTHVVTKYARGLTPEQVQRAVQAMDQLKTHPREETNNRFLLRRAERVYQEVPLEGGSRLGMLMDGFEEAVERGEASAIESNGRALQEFLDRHDQGLDDYSSEYGDDSWSS